MAKRKRKLASPTTPAVSHTSKLFARMVQRRRPLILQCPSPGGPWKRSLRRRLVAWFRGAKRDLPWRRDRDAYRIWVSEVMLQQTQVATVIPYYLRFLVAFPSLESLAAADERQVLRLWEGLGYYARARQLRRAAQQCVERHGGEFPRDAAAARALPGVGRYTAGAVLSFAFDQREPIVETNTQRVLCRLLAYRGDASLPAAQRLLWRRAEELLPARGAGQFNQALMELGATICLPRKPLCAACPVARLCRSRQAGLQSKIPRPKRQPAPTAVREAAVVVRHCGRLLLLRYRDGGRWGGLWDFPRFAVEAEEDEALRREIADGVARMTGVEIGPPRELARLRHGVTRFRITLSCYEARRLAVRNRAAAGREMRWVRPKEFEDFPMSVTARKLGRLVAEA